MSDLIPHLVRTLGATVPASAAVDRALIDAAFVLEKSRGRWNAAWPARVVAARVTPGAAAQIARAVAAYVDRTHCGCWALGKTADPTHLPILARALQRHLQPGGDAHELYQALIALEDCGAVGVFGEETRSRSVMHGTENREHAERYLGRSAHARVQPEPTPELMEVAR
jgi:hypothetical protein